VPFTPVYAGQYETEDNQKQTLQKLKRTKKKQTKHSKTKLAWFLWHSARKGGLILQRPRAHAHG